jgi:acyl dehydratase
MTNATEDIPTMGQGLFWQQQAVGDTFRTIRRRITETDLVSFLNCTGMLEAIFLDPDFAQRAVPGRLVPAALTYTLIEGMQLQTICQGTGLALLECSMKTHRPVVVGDTIWAIVSIDSIRPTSSSGRAVVGSSISVFNQDSELVLGYSAVRLIAGNGTITADRKERA